MHTKYSKIRVEKSVADERIAEIVDQLKANRQDLEKENITIEVNIAGSSVIIFLRHRLTRN